MNARGARGYRLLKFATLVVAMVAVLCAASIIAAKGRFFARGNLLGPQRFDCGEVPAGTTVSHTFSIANPLKSSLIISDVKKSCGCLLLHALPKSVNPGSSLDVPVSIETRGLSGAFHQQVVIVLRDHPPIILTMQGVALSSFRDYADFGEVLKGESVHQDIEVKALGTETLRIRDIRYDDRYFTVELLPSESNSRNWNLRVGLRPDIPYGHFRGDLEFRKTGDSDERCHIQLDGYVFRPVEADPSRIVFGTLSADDRATRSLRVYSPYGQEVLVTAVHRGKSDTLSCELTEPLMGHLLKSRLC